MAKKGQEDTNCCDTLQILLSESLHLRSLTCSYDVNHLELPSSVRNPSPRVLWQPPELHRFSPGASDLCTAVDGGRGRKMGAQRAFLPCPLSSAAPLGWVTEGLHCNWTLVEFKQPRSLCVAASQCTLTLKCDGGEG